MDCNSVSYELPTLKFIGGETVDVTFRTLFRDTEVPLDITGWSAKLTVVDHIHRICKPVTSKQLEFAAFSDGTPNAIHLELTSNETLGMIGKYIYQIEIKDDEDVCDVMQGEMFATANNYIDR